MTRPTNRRVTDSESARILVVDDSPGMRDLIAAVLTADGLVVQGVGDGDAAIRSIESSDYDAVLTDVRMPGINGVDLCETITERRPELPVVVMTAFGSMETAVAAMRAGAYDFVSKPVENDLLLASVRRAVRHGRLVRQVRLLEDRLPAVQPEGLLGQSEPMRRVFDSLGPIAASGAAVLITGESGTGKEVVARAVHRNSPRCEGPFVAINCAALSETLLESELFGHTRGAFTDAHQDRDGLFVAANGGTLLLDEMGDMPMSTQVKLLRVLEEGKVRAVGSNREQTIDVRIVSATHRDLEVAVEEGRFRGDLFYRINVINIDLPPLRHRGNDILMIANHFVRQFADANGRGVVGITKPAAARLLAYHWPGNIRELRNVIERAVALSTTDHVGLEDLPDKVIDHQTEQVTLFGTDADQLVPIAEIERRYIDHVLRATGGNRTRAANILGLDRKTLYRKLKQSEDDSE